MTQVETLTEIIQELIARDYESARMDLWLSSCGHVEEEARWYKQIAVDTRSQITAIEVRAGISLDRSFIKDTADEETNH